MGNNKIILPRRSFLFNLLSMPFVYSSALSASNVEQGSNKKVIDWSHGLPPLFCTAYIDPGILSQQDQEKNVSRYPIALVPQDSREHFRKWRDTVRNYNPDIKLLAYQMVIEETTVPGPGHSILSKTQKSWVTYPGGITPTVTYRTAPNRRQKRIYDPREKEWQENFINACLITLKSYPYDGLFLDQCTIYGKAALNPLVRNKMFLALGETIDKLRNEVGDKILIANSRYNWSSLNGELNESRSEQLAEETGKVSGRYKPRIELFQYYMKNSGDVLQAKTMFRKALENQVFFASSINAQTVKWHQFYDEVMNEYVVV